MNPIARQKAEKAARNLWLAWVWNSPTPMPEDLVKIRAKGLPRECRKCRDCGKVWFSEVVPDAQRSTFEWHAAPEKQLCECGSARVKCLGPIVATGHGVADCDGRCTGAIGPNCDCHCRGENHGRGRGR